MMAIEDRFDRVAEGYSAFRPHYPAALFDLVASFCPRRELAWEAGCGSGQATVELAARFDRVEANDPAASAIARAPAMTNVSFKVGRAESCALGAGTVDLIAAAQAAHWFDMPTFVTEARRVSRPGGIVAVWMYDRCVIDDAVDAIVDHLYHEILKGFWDPRRGHIDARYTTLEFPFSEIEVTPPDVVMEWTLDHLLGYLRTWSAVEKYSQQVGTDAVALVEADLGAAWRDAEQARPATFPVTLRLGRVHG